MYITQRRHINNVVRPQVVQKIQKGSVMIDEPSLGFQLKIGVSNTLAMKVLGRNMNEATAIAIIALLEKR